MNLTDYISNDYKAIELDTDITEVKSFFKNLPFTHFPIVEKGKYVGMLAQSDIIHFSNEEIPLKELSYFFEKYQIGIPDNYFDLIAFFAQNETDILPITDENIDYLGYFELGEIIHLLYATPLFQSGSTTLIVQKESNDFNMSEIAQIVESNGKELLGIFISDNSNNYTQITIRVNTEEINELTQSFRRYDYHVVTQSVNDLLIEELKDRSEYLDKYLKM